MRSQSGLLLGVALLSACAQIGVTNEDGDEDTETDADSDTDSDVDTDTDSDVDTDADSDTADDPVPCTEEDAEELCGDPALCVDGFCCDTVCGGGCDACNLAGLEGTCSLQPATAVCREAVGVCDAIETCDGESAECPADALLTEEDECRPAANDCDVAELCDGESADGCPADAFVDADEPCGSADDAECTAPDTCDGSGTCLANHVVAETACGSADDTVCDDPDTCDGSGSCAPNHESISYPCGSSADSTCDDPDTCDGSGACGTNNAAAGVSCGSTLETTCNHADSCDGSGSCATNLEPGTTVCRAAVNDCDLAESCDGSGNCPANAYVTPGVSCGSTSDTECDDPDTCNGAGTCLQNYVSPGIACTTTTNPCELAAECNGSGECAGGGFVDDGTPCNSTADTECDDPDTCDAFGSCEPNWVGPGNACGSSGSTACDGADSCDGLGTCLGNQVSAGVSCGSPANTQCTDPDTCDGSGSCSANDATSGVACGSSASTTCDGADSCDGSGACLVNYASGLTTCRVAVDACDVAESCDGAGNCPADAFAGAGAACGSSAVTSCTAADGCDGSGSCLANNAGDGTTCGTSVTEYRCDGTGCAAIPQARTVDQHCQTGVCTSDSVAWGTLDTCAADEICLASTSAAWCDLCNAFPANYCSSGDAYQYGSTYGACSGGACTYTPTFVDCTYGCTGGACNTAMFFEDFEDGDYAGWTVVSATASIATPGANGTSDCLQVTGSTAHYSGIYRAFSPALTPTHIAWWARSSSTTTADTYFVIHSSGGTGLSYQLAFIYFNSTGYIAAADSPGDFYAYTANTWYYLELRNINYTTHTFDIYVNGVLDTAAAPFRANVSNVGRIDLYNFASATGRWDEILFE